MFGLRECSRLWGRLLFFKPTCSEQSLRSTFCSFACLGLILPSLAPMGQNHRLNCTSGPYFWTGLMETGTNRDQNGRFPQGEHKEGWDKTNWKGSSQAWITIAVFCCLFHLFQVTNGVEIAPGAWWIEHFTVYEGRLRFHLTLLITFGSLLLGKRGKLISWVHIQCVPKGSGNLENLDHWKNTHWSERESLTFWSFLVNEITVQLWILPSGVRVSERSTVTTATL